MIDLPTSIAPNTSKIVPSMHACRMVSTLEPIDVPKEFATSFAPSPNANTNAMMNPTITSHNQSGSTISISNLLRCFHRPFCCFRLYFPPFSQTPLSSNFVIVSSGLFYCENNSIFYVDCPSFDDWSDEKM